MTATTAEPLGLILTADALAPLRQLYLAAKVEQARADLARIDPVAAALRWRPRDLFTIETGFVLPRLDP